MSVPSSSRALKLPSWRRLLRRLDFALGQSEQERLWSDIASLQAAIDRYQRQSTSPAGGAWKQACDDELEKARAAADVRDVHSGYESLHTAERESVMGMSPEDCAVRARSLRLEATTKMSDSWRRTAVLECLKCDSAPIGPRALMEAIGHRNTVDRNSRRKADSLKTQMMLIRWGLTCLIGLALFAAWRWPTQPIDIGRLPYAVYLGLLGGIVSSAMSLRQQDRQVAVPEIQMSWQLTTTRVLIGAAVAIPVFMISTAGLVTIGPAAAGSSSTAGQLLLCFVSGFSERWFMSTMLSLSGDAKESSAKATK